MSSDLSIQGTGGNRTIEAMKNVEKSTEMEIASEALESKEGFQESLAEMVNPQAARMSSRQKEIGAQTSRIGRTRKSDETPEEAARRKAENSAKEFQGRNPELKGLMTLRDRIQPDDTEEEILAKLAESYPEASCASEALLFLIQTASDEGLKTTLTKIKENFDETNKKAIASGQNIRAQARAAAGSGLGAVQDLTIMYNEVTDNPRDSTTLFDELSAKYPFDKLKNIIHFLLHCLGTDMKSKGPSIPKGQLHRLFNETRSLQAILGVYKFFRGRMRLVEKQFKEQNLPMPAELTFESIAKQFMSLVSERYPSSARVLQTASKLGIEGQIIAMIITFSQMRDGVREVAMNHIFKGVQHRDELYVAILETLDDLEEKLDDISKQEEQADIPQLENIVKKLGPDKDMQQTKTPKPNVKK